MARGNIISYHLRGDNTTSIIPSMSSSTKQAYQDSSASSTTTTSSNDNLAQEVQPPPQHLGAWMYWLRDDSTDGNCYTKVYAILKNEFLSLYPQDRCVQVENKTFLNKLYSSRNRPLKRIAVTKAQVSLTGGFRIEDPHGEQMMLYLYNRYDVQTANEWENGLKVATTKSKCQFNRFESTVKEFSKKKTLYVGRLHDYRQRQQVVKNMQTSYNSFKQYIFQGRQQGQHQYDHESSPSTCSTIQSIISVEEKEEELLSSSHRIQKPRNKSFFQRWKGRSESA
jgi:hypothetical protein